MTKQINNVRTDVYLFIAAIVALVIVVSTQLFRHAARPKRIDIAVSQSGETLFGRDMLDALISEFEEQNPDLRIRVMDDNNADVVFFEDGELGGLLAGSALASLGPYIHSETEARSWAIPLVSFMDIFLYNIDILQAAGGDRPPKTRAELLAATRAVAAKEAAFPLALGLSEEDPLALRRELYPWVWAAGGDLRQNSAENGDRDDAGDVVPEITLSRTATDMIAFFGQLNREGLLAPGSLEQTRAQRLQEFAAGNVAMMAASSRDIPLLRRDAQDINFDLTAMPQAAQGKNRMGLSGIYAGISSACAMPDEAWTFLAFIAGRKHLLEEALNAVPGSYPGTFPSGYITSDPLYSKAWDIFEAADIVEYHPAAPLEEETGRIIREKLEEVFEQGKNGE